MGSNYWTKRISRRRAIAGTATLGVGALAASLLSCGGDGDDKPVTLSAEPVDTTKQAVKGGILQDWKASEGLNFDAATGTGQVTTHTVMAYSRLVRYKMGSVTNPPDGSLEPDGAQSWEQSPDGLQITFKLRQGMKYDARPPTNGRTINSGDVKYFWDRFSALSPDRGNWAASAVPGAPIERFEYPDANTVVARLTLPMGSMVRRFAGNFYIVPVEAEDKFDIKQDMRGSGAWMLNKFERSVGWEYRRNPNWYLATERPFLDGINYAVIPQSATTLAQFEAKRIWFLKPANEQVVGLKRSHPELRVVAVNPIKSLASARMLALSKLESSPLQKDARLRYAISMLIDRDAWLDTFSDVSGLEKQGLPIEAAWHSHISCGATEWLDPKTGKLGEASKYFQHNPDEAAKLLRAAGKLPVESEISYPTSSFLAGTENMPKWMEVFRQMLEEGGHFKLKVNTGDYTAWYQPAYNRTRAQVEGIFWQSAGGGEDLDDAIWGVWAPGSRNDTIGFWDRVPGLEDIMMRHRREQDEKKRVAITHEFQLAMAKQMPHVLFPGLATTFTTYWPWVGNAGFFRSRTGLDTPDTLAYMWYDKAKDDRQS